MALTITKRCNRCRQPMRNDGTVENPIWACDNPNCVKYKEHAENQEKQNNS